MRARKTDIPALLCFFMHQQGYHLAPTSEAMRLLEDYSYPGNIRELKHIVELAALKAGDGMLRPEHLPEAVLRQEGAWWHAAPAADSVEARALAAQPGDCAPAAWPVSERHAQTEAQRVLETLRRCGGSRRQAARELGISERKMYRLLKRYEQMGLKIPAPYQMVSHPNPRDAAALEECQHQ